MVLCLHIMYFKFKRIKFGDGVVNYFIHLYLNKRLGISLDKSGIMWRLPFKDNFLTHWFMFPLKIQRFLGLQV